MELKDYVEKCHATAREKGFWDTKRELGTMLMLIVSELGEALEADRKGYKNFVKPLYVKKPEYEIWKEIPGYEGEYEVSNLGRVQSLERKVWGGKSYYQKKGRILSPGLEKTGYWTVVIHNKTHKVARLVGFAFLENPNNCNTINHKNGIKTCDWITNLEWTTQSENNKHALDTKLRKPASILTYDEKVQIALRFKNKETAPEIWKDYPQVSLSAIKAIRQRGIERYTESVEFEICDTFIRLFDMCGGLGIDIEKHIIAKMTYNETRARLHGKKY